MRNVRSTLFLVLSCLSLASNESLACGSHSCGGGGGAAVSVRVRVAVNVGGGGCGGGGCGGGGYGYGWGGRPFFGRGAVAFRRSRRLARRSRRAAFFGFYGRANNLAYRSDAAFQRGVNRYNYGVGGAYPMPYGY